MLSPVFATETVTGLSTVIASSGVSTTAKTPSLTMGRNLIFAQGRPLAEVLHERRQGLHALRGATLETAATLPPPRSKWELEDEEGWLQEVRTDFESDDKQVWVELDGDEQEEVLRKWRRKDQED
ncbi:hypothetical protein B0H19DRAFT_1060906 [Mycena capillaripes]|nr:hypothetical protein B0H19DRAFT_1060906 [Mycena capillaripes]